MCAARLQRPVGSMNTPAPVAAPACLRKAASEGAEEAGGRPSQVALTSASAPAAGAGPARFGRKGQAAAY